MSATRLTRHALVACAALFATGALAQSSYPPAPTGDKSSERRMENRLASEDRDFLENASQAGQVEIEGSRLAEEKATSAEVKTFAKQMIEDHTKAHRELVTLATRKGFTLPDEGSIMQRTELTALKAVSGETFDKMYASRIGVNAHEKTLELFREAASKAKDPEIKAYAAKYVPALEKHLGMARTLRDRVGKE
ncbi:DUF4142 domain-containing protein [Azoarcus olearius]|uniref:Conserved hypothetical secreted protein n=1 Tax=Azoarcus sp. (strain BH72) TaxID=418699 RepID=A1K296_AZOSB|nr:DUF4142 domain-containing protein [Azoarcus olearius]CAL92951.1 conserved hypothetical secreted protein [Azoarcus olearius]